MNIRKARYEHFKELQIKITCITKMKNGYVRSHIKYRLQVNTFRIDAILQIFENYFSC